MQSILLRNSPDNKETILEVFFVLIFLSLIALMEYRFVIHDLNSSKFYLVQKIYTPCKSIPLFCFNTSFQDICLYSLEYFPGVTNLMSVLADY